MRLAMLLIRRCVAVAVVLSVCAELSVAVAAPTTLTWYGQSAFVLKTPKGHVIAFDPWFDNAMNPPGNKVADTLDRVDLILVSHGHFDHVGIAASLAKRAGAKLVATLDLGEALVRYGGFPKENAGFETLGNYGGVLTFFDGEVQILLVPAVHSSHVSGQDLGINNDAEKHWAGGASGFVVKVAGGPTIYHTGDTDYFSDMALVNRFAPIDVMLLCIGDHFTMGPARAAAAVALVKPKRAVPMHYGTFLPLMTGTPAAFSAALKQRHLGTLDAPMKVGEPVTF